MFPRSATISLQTRRHISQLSRKPNRKQLLTWLTEREGPTCLACWTRSLAVNSTIISNHSRAAPKQKPFYGNDFVRGASSNADNDSEEEKKVKGLLQESTRHKVVTAMKERLDSIITVKPTIKKKPKTDFSKSYTANIYITPLRAMDEYLLNLKDLEPITKYHRRSPYPEKDDIVVYLRRDVEKRAVEKFGSLEDLRSEQEKRRRLERKMNRYLLIPNVKADKRRSLSRKVDYEDLEEGAYVFYKAEDERQKETIFRHGSGKVVIYAIAVNGANCVFKFAAWMYTGSHSMFSEFLHSAADTANQIILAIGLHQSLKGADMEHPYGWANVRNVTSLISGVGIFCIGAGLSWYHGIVGLMDHQGFSSSLFWALCILAGSFVSEGATLLVAIEQVKKASKEQKMSFLEYVWRGLDPSTNVVLLEDLAAVIGVVIAGGCMGLTYYTGNPLFDATGSLLIGTLLGGVASFIIYTNTVSLVGRSIAPERKETLQNELEDDRMIRALHDVKATDMGGNYVRFKAEVDFDGREVTRKYLENQDLEKMLQEVQSLPNVEQLESYMLKQGENIVDTLGGEVDRIEKNLKSKHPEIRHVDLEQL